MFIIVNKVVKYGITGVILRFFEYLCSTKRLIAAYLQTAAQTLNNNNYVHFKRKPQEISCKAQF